MADTSSGRRYGRAWVRLRRCEMAVTPKRHAWEGIIPETDLVIDDRAGFGRKGGLGKRPGIVIIDVQYRTVGREPGPILEAMETYPTACGQAGWDAVHGIAKLLAVARP